MTKANIHSSFASLESCQLRLASRRQRQVKLRRLLLQHLDGNSCTFATVETPTDAFDDALYQCSLANVLSAYLGVKSNEIPVFDDNSNKKTLIMPVIRQIRRPRLSYTMLRFLTQCLDAATPSHGYTIHNGQIVRRGSIPQDNFDNKDVMYTGTSNFLKGTQSANPHNDYCQHFVDTGERPQNFIRDTGLRNRFEEYPKLRELIRLKDELIQIRSTPPMYLKVDLANFNLLQLNSMFDVILVEPPSDRSWSWLEIERLEIEKIAAPRSFIWIWCGSGEGLDGARKCIKKWGFRRCEDICWIKTNKMHPIHEQLEPGAVLQRTKEHCLMGIHGTVRRSVDGDFIHANLDIDLIISEAKAPGSYGAKDKPPEIFHIIEHFCQGRRRLHIFGRDSTLRAGWVTIGNDLSASNFDPQVYNNYFSCDPNGGLLGSSEEIERLRPKSPPPRFQPGQAGIVPNLRVKNSSVTPAQCASASLTGRTDDPTTHATPSLLGKPMSTLPTVSRSSTLNATFLSTLKAPLRYRSSRQRGVEGHHVQSSSPIPQCSSSPSLTASVAPSNSLLDLLLSAQGRQMQASLSNPLWHSLVGQIPTPSASMAVSPVAANLAALQTSLLWKHQQQQQQSQLQRLSLSLAAQAASSASVLPSPHRGGLFSSFEGSSSGAANDKAALAMQIFAAAASSFQPGEFNLPSQRGRHLGAAPTPPPPRK